MRSSESAFAIRISQAETDRNWRSAWEPEPSRNNHRRKWGFANYPQQYPQQCGAGDRDPSRSGVTDANLAVFDAGGPQRDRGARTGQCRALHEVAIGPVDTPDRHTTGRST